MNTEQSKVERPEIVTEDHLEFLDELRESGVTNMYGATPYLMGQVLEYSEFYEDGFPELTLSEAGKILAYWMDSFTERHG